MHVCATLYDVTAVYGPQIYDVLRAWCSNGCLKVNAASFVVYFHDLVFFKIMFLKTEKILFRNLFLGLK